MKKSPFNPTNTLIAPKRKTADLGLILILALLPLLFFWRLITPNPTDRMQITGGDFTEQYFPLRAFTAQEWVQGRVPLWNPYLYGGQPALADIQSGALYPPHIIEALILGWGVPLFGWEIGFPVWALELQIILHFSIAAVGTYLFVRHLGLRHHIPLRRARFGGVMASLIFTYGGYLTGFPVQQITILQASAWLPWLLWGLSVAERRGAEAHRSGGVEKRRSSGAEKQESGDKELQTTNYKLRPAAWSALAFALAILAGHPQTVLYIFYLSLAYTFFLGFQRWRSSRANIKRHAPFHLPLFHSFLLWLFTITLGSLIAAAQLLPTLEFIDRSLRADLSYQAVSAGLPLNELIAILYPGFFGGSPEYVGLVALVLIAFVLTITWPRPNKSTHSKKNISNLQSPISPSPHPQSPHPQSPISPSPISNLPISNLPISIFPSLLFWAAAALISLLLAFGGSTFLYALFYLLAPGFEAVRQQERAFLVYSFSAAILTGYGAMLLTGPLPKSIRPIYALFERRLRLVALVAFGMTAFFIYGSTAATARGDEVNLFFGVLRHHLFGLLILGGLLIWLAFRPRRWPRRPWGMALLAVWTAFNLFTVNWRFNLAEPDDSPPFTSSGGVQFLQANLPISSSPNLPPARIVSGGLLPGGNSAASVYNLQDLTGNTPLQLARVDTFLQQMPSWRLWQLMNVRYIVDNRDISNEGLRLVFEEDELKVFEMGDPFPRAWFVSQVEVIPDFRQAIARLAADDFDLRRTAVVEAPLDLPLADAAPSSFEITQMSPTTLLARVETPAPQLLVLSQIHYPGWQARLDGQPVDIERVNGVQQGVVVPAGSHRIELYFAPSSFTRGLILSAMGLIICLVILVIPARFGKWL